MVVADSVRLIQAELEILHAPKIECVSSRHQTYPAWVKENNPKRMCASLQQTLSARRHPDCRLGLQTQAQSHHPFQQSQVCLNRSVVNLLGYGSGVIVTKNSWLG